MVFTRAINPTDELCQQIAMPTRYLKRPRTIRDIDNQVRKISWHVSRCDSTIDSTHPRPQND
jgi:hypothetical protein